MYFLGNDFTYVESKLYLYSFGENNENATNLAQWSFSVKLTTICQKKGAKVWAQFLSKFYDI